MHKPCQLVINAKKDPGRQKSLSLPSRDQLLSLPRAPSCPFVLLCYLPAYLHGWGREDLSSGTRTWATTLPGSELPSSALPTPLRRSRRTG